ncbi:unnamed protein product [Orchesella dallaii]|uniref:Metalloendopeptidase n=1 Tax=Orchesella dallaii TaxID=48710 RepID=A0ABP1RII3_9HEXA
MRHSYESYLWPNAVVTYRLHTSIRTGDDEDLTAASEAMNDISSKTCITFEEKKKGDKNFVDLMVDHNKCGHAQMCMVGGRQFAKFGGSCRTMDTMVHELGHVLCLHHEHERPDRDHYLEFEGCSEDPVIEPAHKKHPLGIYDYGSQMHYGCGSCIAGSPKMEGVTKCGDQITYGLSIIDADNLNALYNCQGCYRHRWRPIEHLTSEDVKNMYSFGYEDSVGKISPCRGLMNGEITVGKYNWKTKICSLSFGGKEYQYQYNYGFEVLTIPGGLKQNGATYKLVKRKDVRSSSIIEIPVPAGREAESGNAQTGFIAYVTVGIAGGGQEDSIGKVWVRDGVLQKALFVSEGEEYYVEEKYRVLTCG